MTIKYIINILFFNLNLLLNIIHTITLNKINFLPTYYIRSENLWNDGYLFDFLQKKTIDSWVRQFVIYTAFLFSERFIFDIIIRFYLDNIIWPLHNKSIIEVSNVSEILLLIILFYFIIFLLLFIFYIILIV